jgi:hypothetical protein
MKYHSMKKRMYNSTHSLNLDREQIGEEADCVSGVMRTLYQKK